MKGETLAKIFLVIATVGILAAIMGYEKYRFHELYTVDLVARAPENGNWDPRTIKVPYGKEVSIRIRNIETVSHGFSLPDFNVGAREVKDGSVYSVKFTPDKKGSFPFYCTMWCSEHHMNMTGTLVVE